MGANVQKQQPKRYVPQDLSNQTQNTKNKPPAQAGASVQVQIEQPVLTLKRNGGGNTVMEAPVILPGSLKRNTLEEALDDENSSPEDVILDDMFIFSDFTIDTSILAETVTPFGKRKQKKIAHGTIKLDSFAGGGVAIASLTIPLIIKSKLIHNVANANKKNPGVKFDFSDFQVILTEDELNEEIIRKSGAMFGNIEVKELLEARNNKVSRILNYTITTLLGRSSRIKCLRLTPDEKRLVACSHDDQILVMYDLSTCKPVLQFQGHEDTVMSICFSPDGKFLCSSSRDETIIMWDVSTAKQVHVMQHSSMVITCDYSRDGQHIVSGCQDKVCRVWEARSGKELLSFSDHQGLIICICIAPDSRLVASASADRTLMLWELRTGRRRQILRGHSGVVLSCAFSPDNLRVVSNDEKNIKIWNARDGKLLQTLGMEERVPSRSSALPIPHLTNMANRVEMKYILSAYSPGSHIVSAVNNKVVQLLDPNTGGETLSLFLKASVYSCCCGNINTIALGDANGNIYIVKLVLENDHLALPPSAMRHLAGERRSED